MSTASVENMVLRTVYLPKALDNQLRDRAFGLSLSKGEFIRILIQEALERRASGEPLTSQSGAAGHVQLTVDTEELQPAE